MFDSVPLAIWNVAAIGLWLAALVDIARIPGEHWHNRRGRVLLLLLVGAPSIFWRGAFLPVVPVLWFAWLRRTGVMGLRPWADRRAMHS